MTETIMVGCVLLVCRYRMERLCSLSVCRIPCYTNNVSLARYVRCNWEFRFFFTFSAILRYGPVVTCGGNRIPAKTTA